MKPVRVASGCLLAATIGLLLGCEGGDVVPPPMVRECTGPIDFTVRGDTVPVFSWSPECKIGRIIVEQGFDEYWGSETCGMNDYTPPMMYGETRPNTCPEEPAIPLTPGATYTVSAWRFVTVMPESLGLLGQLTFTYLDSVRTP